MSLRTNLEIAAEVAWIIGDNEKMPRAESRWAIVRMAEQIIEDGIINEESEDIDETITSWLIEKGYK